MSEISDLVAVALPHRRTLSKDVAVRPEAGPSRQRTVERLAPALALLANGLFARQVAETMGVSTATILTWMDWGWRHRPEVEAHLEEHYPHLTAADLRRLWQRVQRRHDRRQRRLDLTAVLSGA